MVPQENSDRQEEYSMGVNDIDIEGRMVKFYSEHSSRAPLHAAPGHFATSHSHINYYIDLTSLKTRIDEAKEVAKIIEQNYRGSNKIFDTIVCMDGTETVGTFLAQEFEDHEYLTSNKHNTIYVVITQYEPRKVHRLLMRSNFCRFDTALLMRGVFDIYFRGRGRSLRDSPSPIFHPTAR